jgi:hypothetical protein
VPDLKEIRDDRRTTVTGRAVNLRSRLQRLAQRLGPPAAENAGPPLPGALERARAVLRALAADPSSAPPGLDTAAVAAALGGAGAEAAAERFLDTACNLGCVPAPDGEIDFHLARLGEAGCRAVEEVAAELGLA